MPWINEVWGVFHSAKARLNGASAIVGMPVLWFGNLQAYLDSPIRVLTVGLNPSFREFNGKDGVDSRFPHTSSLAGKKKLTQADIQDYLDDLNDYFNHNPYWGWFWHFEAALKGIDASYENLKGAKNVALHIDLGTSFASFPGWSSLSDDETNSLKSRCDELYNGLIQMLSPNLIIFGCGKTHLKDRSIESLNNVSFPGTKKTISISKNGEVPIIWIAPSGRTPFDSMPADVIEKGCANILESYPIF